MQRLFIFCLFFLFLAAPQGNSFASSDSKIQQQRKAYGQAKARLSKGDAKVFAANRKLLADYLLTPYLVHDELRLRLKTASNKEVESFLLEHGDLPQIRMFKYHWLQLLAERQQWQLFSKYYSPELNFVELDCLAGQAQLALGLHDAAYQLAEKLWLSSQSRPNTCNPLFDAWHKAGLRSQDKVWQRLILAVESRNYGLAKYLAGLYQDQATAKLLIEVAQKPSLIKDKNRFTASKPQANAIVAIGLRRLFREDVDSSLQLLDYYQQQLKFSPTEQQQITRDIGVILAKRFDERGLQVLQQWSLLEQDQQIAEWNARLLLRSGRWSEASSHISKMPSSLTDTHRWRYWQVRSNQIANPLAETPLASYQELAKERDFYSFMAADRSKQPYQLNNRPVKVKPAINKGVKNNLSIRRAIELHSIGEPIAAMREWQHASRLFDQEQLKAQAQLAFDMGWYNPAIRNLAQAQYWDDLDIRFPTAYKNQLLNAAKSRDLHSSWVYAIARQESAFMPDIKSHAGALGLMQVMPATAKETARRYSIPLRSNYQVIDPDTNTQLGAAYLHQMMGQFGGNRILASAAYNAGPNRVRQWLKEATHLPYDIWIETIPFDETRQYVQNVLTYSVIYGEKLEKPTPLVQWHEQLLEKTTDN